MNKNTEQRRNDDMRPHYDFASMKGGVRRKYYDRYLKGTNVVLIEPDVAAAFPTEVAVNEALRGILGKARAVRRTGGLADRDLNSGPPAGRNQMQCEGSAKLLPNRQTLRPGKPGLPFVESQEAFGSKNDGRGNV